MVVRRRVLGGAVGLGTVLFAFGIGPLVTQALLPFFVVKLPDRLLDGLPEGGYVAQN